jgi:hypothetical protein
MSTTRRKAKPLASATVSSETPSTLGESPQGCASISASRPLIGGAGDRLGGQALRRPDEDYPVEPIYLQSYTKRLEFGREECARRSVSVVAIARDCGPQLENTLGLIDELVARFQSAKMYVFENDSTDGTPGVLDTFASSRPWVTIEHDTLNLPDIRGFQRERTEALAKYRQKCVQWAKNNKTDYVVVIDMDPQGGFSVDGVINSVGWLCDINSRTNVRRAGGMASYGVAENNGNHWHFDAWAARLNWWEDRRDVGGRNMGLQWFFHFHPPIGSEPIRFNSAFGGLAIYLHEAFVQGEYLGVTCEHVPFHESMDAAGYDLYLNPASRYVAVCE